MIGAVNRDQQLVLPPRKVSLVEFESWAQKYLYPTDEVALEATTNAWSVHDLLKPLVGRGVVTHPSHIKLIAATMVKTDKRDTKTLAKLLAVNLVPEVWVPSGDVRDLRALIAHRRRLISQQTQCKNRLQSVLHRNHIVPPGGKLYRPDTRTWRLDLALSPGDKLRVRQELIMLDQLDTLISETTDELHRLSLSDPWREQLPYLIQLPGIGVLTGMVMLSAIGDITRFPSAKKLVGYAGLEAKVHSSGLSHRTGGITKQGRRELRAALVESAWVAVQFDTRWRDGLGGVKPSWLSLASCWSSFGTSCTIAGWTARLTPNGWCVISWLGAAKPKPLLGWISKHRYLPGSSWTFWVSVRSYLP